MRRPTHALALLAILAAGAGVLAVRDSAAQTPPAFTETFDGSPLSPAPFAPADWWVQYHHRSPGAWVAPEMMEAQHDPLCAAPPATHHIMAWTDSVFHCRDHVMTAISASSYGVLYLTPPAMVDFSQIEAVVRFDISTARIGPRDWWDLWVTPKTDAMALPLETDWPDLQGVPRNAVTVRLNESQYRFNGLVSRNYAVTGLPTNTGLLYNNLFTPSFTLRQTVELRISRTHIQFGMPYPTLDNGSIGPPRWWINATVADLGWDQGVIHLGHHSYSPLKACAAFLPSQSTGNSVALRSLSGARPAYTHVANFGDIDVSSTQRVTTETVGLVPFRVVDIAAIPRVALSGTSLVLGTGDEFQVGGIDAMADRTEMVNFHVHWYRAMMQSIRNPMRVMDALMPDGGLSVPVGHEIRGPQPAGVSLGDVSPEELWSEGVGDGEGFTQHLRHSMSSVVPIISRSMALTLGCGPNTWHWDNLTISPAVPLSLARFPDHLIQDEADRPLPATAGAVWFSAVTNQVMSCSFDGGFTWQGATLVRGSRQQTTYGPVEHASSWRCAIPPGAVTVRFRGANVPGWAAWTVFDPAVVP